MNIQLEEKATFFFIKSLANAASGNSIHHVKLFQNLISNGEAAVGAHFKKFNESEKYKFFDNKREFFSMDAGYVFLSELWKVVNFKRCRRSSIVTVENVYATLGPSIDLDNDASLVPVQNVKEKRVIDYVLCHLRNCGPTHFLSLLEVIENDHSDMKDFFLFFSKFARFWFFRQHLSSFISAEGGFLFLAESGTCSFENIIEEKITELLSLLLSYTGMVHTERLVKCAIFSSLQMRKYFSNFKKELVHNFFKIHNNHFVLKEHGYILPRAAYKNLNIRMGFDDAVQQIPTHVLETSVFYLQKLGTINYEKLVNCLQMLSSKFLDFFSVQTDAEIIVFFQSCSHIEIWEDGMISLQQKTIDSVSFNLADNSLDNDNKGVSADSKIVRPGGKTIKDTILQIFIEHLETSKTEHYEKLILAAKKYIPEAKPYFSNYDNSQKFAFFRCHPDLFTIGNSGYVSLKKRKEKIIEPTKNTLKLDSDEIVPQLKECFVSLLKKQGPLHYQILADFMKQAHPQYRQILQNSSLDDIFWFFKKHEDMFEVNDLGTVLLLKKENTKTDNSKSITIIDKIMNYLVLNLTCSGPIHYEKLVRCLKGRAPEIKDYFLDRTSTEVLGFFKNHPEKFAIKKGGVISLYEKNYAESVPNQNEADTQATKFIVNYLKEKGQVSMGKLSNILQHSTVEINRYLNGCSPPDVQNHIENHKKYFIVDSKQNVSLRLDELPASEQENVIKYFVTCLSALGTAHFKNLELRLKSSSSNISEFFNEYTSIDVCNFFKSFPDIFRVDNAENVSLVHANKKQKKARNNLEEAKEAASSKTSSSTLIELEIVKLMTAKLSKDGSIHYEKLCNCSPKIKSFFSQLAQSEKFAFFRERNWYFKIASDGYVQKSNKTFMKDIVTFFTNILKKFQPLSCNKLRSIAMSLNSNANLYFQDKSYQDIYVFLKERPEQFTFDDKNYVSLVQNNKKPVTAIASSTQAVKSTIACVENIANPAQPIIQTAQISHPQNEVDVLPIHPGWKTGKIKPSFHSNSPLPIAQTNLQHLPSIILSKLPQLQLDRHQNSLNSERNVPTVVDVQTVHVPTESDISPSTAKHINSARLSSRSSSVPSGSSEVDQSIKNLNDLENDVQGVQNQSLLEKGKGSFVDMDKVSDKEKVVETAIFKREVTSELVKDSNSSGTVCLDRKDKITERIINFCLDKITEQGSAIHYSTLFYYLKRLPEGVTSAFDYDSKEMEEFFKNRTELFNIDADGYVTTIFPTRNKAATSFANNQELKGKDVTKRHRKVKSASSTKPLLPLSKHEHAIRIFISHLLPDKSIHLKDLFERVCDKDRDVKTFFISFTLNDVSKFLKLHSFIFSIHSSGVVSLCNLELNSWRTFTDEQLHFLVSAIEKEAVGFFVRMLESKGEISTSIINKCLTSAPPYIISFLKNNHGKTILSFFQKHDAVFRINHGAKTIKLVIKDAPVSPSNKVPKNTTSSSKLKQTHPLSTCDKLYDHTHSCKDGYVRADTCKDGPQQSNPQEPICKDRPSKITNEKSRNFSYSRQFTPIDTVALLASIKSLDNNAAISDIVEKKEVSHAITSDQVATSRDLIKNTEIPTVADRSQSNESSPIHKQLIHSLSQAYKELNNVKKALTDFPISQPRWNFQEADDENRQQNIILKSLKSLAVSYDPVIDRQCVEQFELALLSMGPSTLPALGKVFEKFSDNIKSYITRCYGNENLAFFFYMHLCEFSFDGRERVSVRSLKKERDDSDWKSKAINYFLLFLSKYSSGISLKRIRRCLLDASPEVKIYMSSFKDPTFFFTSNSDHFYVDELNRVFLNYAMIV